GSSRPSAGSAANTTRSSWKQQAAAMGGTSGSTRSVSTGAPLGSPFAAKEASSSISKTEGAARGRRASREYTTAARQDPFSAGSSATSDPGKGSASQART